MPDPITALVVGGSQLIGSSMQASAAGSAAETQAAAAQTGIEEQRRQFDAMQALLKPYTEAGAPAIAGLQTYAQAGAPAFEQQQALLGLRGPEAQRTAMLSIEGGAGFQSQVQAGEEALLQRASATGGVRGGNIQGALAQFRPQMLRQEIETQYGRLGGIANIGRETLTNLLKIGQSSAAGLGAAGMESGTNISNLLAQQGAARAGGQIGEAKAYGQLFNLPAQFIGAQYGAGKTPGFGSLFG